MLVYTIGNTGNSLHRSSYNDTKLYFSHDGGFSWQEVMTLYCIKTKVHAITAVDMQYNTYCINVFVQYVARFADGVLSRF